MGSIKDEENFPVEEHERITDLLKRKEPDLKKARAKAFKEHGLIDEDEFHHVLDEKFF